MSLSKNIPNRTGSEELTVVMALYNEEGYIPETLNELHSLLLEQGINHRCLIVESGSTDRSGSLLDELSCGEGWIDVIHEGKRNGFGSGLRLGLKGAESPFVMYCDIDVCSSIMTYIPQGLAMLRDGYDLVIGQRTGRRDNWMRDLGSILYNRFMRVSLQLKGIRDINFSFKMFLNRSLKEFRLQADGWFIDAELMAEAHRKGCRIGQIHIPYRLRTDGKSKVGVSRATTVEPLKELWRYLRYRDDYRGK